MNHEVESDIVQSRIESVERMLKPRWVHYIAGCAASKARDWHDAVTSEIEEVSCPQCLDQLVATMR